jgi:exopolysaccharide biosynthesis polyprenyl glycosylphosphotransferase
MSGYTATGARPARESARNSGRLTGGVTAWTRGYLARAAAIDTFCAVVAVVAALEVRFDGHFTRMYAAISVIFPILWIGGLFMSGSYDSRFIGSGQDEFRKILNYGITLTAVLAIVSYAANEELSREYLLITMPSVTGLDLVARYLARKGLHRRRARGQCMHKVVAVGHELSVAELIGELRRGKHHGLWVVATCVPSLAEAAGATMADVAGVPVMGDIKDVPDVVRQFGADTVAVLACPEIDGLRLRELAWELEKTSTDLVVAPSLLDVAGPRTTVRPAAGLTLLHVDHPQLAGMRRVAKGLFDRCAAAAALTVFGPLMLLLAAVIRLHDRGPALFTQVRIGKDGRTFRIYKFRTMVVDAEQRKETLMPSNDLDGVLFKLRRDPRVTAIGAHLRRWSLDELPQLLNVVRGDMSLVGPRPALPDEAEKYAHHVRRRLVVKPGLTGLWQVNGRSDLSWDESVRLDIRYVENWSLALDVQILWKTLSAITRGSGAY